MTCGEIVDNLAHILNKHMDLAESAFPSDFEVIERHLVAAFAELGYNQLEPRVFVSCDDKITVDVDPAGKVTITHKRGAAKQRNE